MKVRNDKYKVLYLGQTQTLATTQSGAGCLCHSSAEKDLSVLLDKPNVNQTRSLMTPKRNQTLGYARLQPAD